MPEYPYSWDKPAPNHYSRGYAHDFVSELAAQWSEYKSTPVEDLKYAFSPELAIQQHLRQKERISTLLSDIAAMTPGERREMRSLIGMPECSTILWMPNGEGGWTAPIYPKPPTEDQR